MPPSTALRFRGPVLPDGESRDLYVVDGKVTYEAQAGAETVAEGGICRGLVDAHCHLGLDQDGAVDEATTEEQAVADRDAGALLLRDAGSPVDNRHIQDRDDLPRLIRAGRHIARTKRYIRYLGVEVEPEQLVAEVERQAARGDGWVKLAADWIDRSVGDLTPTWPPDALVAAIGRAHELGARVAAHVFGEDALPGLIDAGVDSIEHGTGLTDDLLDAVAGRGIAVVPTLINVDTFPDIARSGAAKFPRYAGHMRALYGTSWQRIRNAYEAGVAIYPGTDAGGSLLHGRIRDELAALVHAGIPQPEVIAQASWRGRAWLGLPGLQEGAPADLVVYPADPRAELGTLFEASRIVLRGNVVR